jgi:hypothetical protein
MPMKDLTVVSLTRRSVAEWVALMEVRGTASETPASFSGQSVRESFGVPRIYENMLRDGDLRPELASEHRGSARYVLERISPGTAGQFTVDANGQFLDYHGGHGLRSGRMLEWFTSRALQRGIGWYFEQRYACNGVRFASFRVIRVVRASGGLHVRKERM